ncbi:MAG: dihydroneopterin aldolase [Bacteroidota bacterium]|jgi:dihydroneopterin aldolase|nr:dihydroneopterin aldolase [Bacteroidota bacterium]
MLSIYLNNVIFWAYHGLYKEEKITGNEFEVNVRVDYVAKEITTFQSIQDTINYVAIFKIVQNRMEKPTPLLEAIAVDIGQQILAEFSMVEKAIISIKKLNPPIPDFKGSVSVSFEINRHHLNKV